MQVRDVLETTLEENLAMIADSVRYPEGPGPHRLLRRRALLRRLLRQPGVRLQLPARRRRGRRRLPRPLRHQRRHHHGTAGRGGRGRSREAVSARPGHPRPQRRRRGGGQHPGRRRGRLHSGAGHHQRLRRALRQRQPDQHHRQPQAEDGHRLRQRRAARAPDGGLPLRERGRQHGAQRPRAPYVGASAFAHKAGLHVAAHGQARSRLPARRPGARRQRAPDPGLGAGRPAQHPHQDQGAGHRYPAQHARRRAACWSR